MRTKSYEGDAPISDWNMGVAFYKSLNDLKWLHMMSFAEKEYELSVNFLLSEIDWVNQDIGEELVVKLRGEVDEVLRKIGNGINGRNNRFNLMRSIIRIRRKLWDAELKAKILRPRDDTDLSNLPMSVINQR